MCWCFAYAWCAFSAGLGERRGEYTACSHACSRRVYLLFIILTSAVRAPVACVPAHGPVSWFGACFAPSGPALARLCGAALSAKTVGFVLLAARVVLFLLCSASIILLVEFPCELYVGLVARTLFAPSLWCGQVERRSGLKERGLVGCSVRVVLYSVLLVLYSVLLVVCTCCVCACVCLRVCVCVRVLCTQSCCLSVSTNPSACHPEFKSFHLVLYFIVVTFSTVSATLYGLLASLA